MSNFKIAKILAKQIINSSTGTLVINGNSSQESSEILTSVGNDVYLFISGSVGGKNVSDVVSFGGDVVISGSLYGSTGIAYTASTSNLWLPTTFTGSDCASGLPEGWWAAGGSGSDAAPVAYDENGITFTTTTNNMHMNNVAFNAPSIFCLCPANSFDCIASFNVFPASVSNTNIGVIVCAGGQNTASWWAMIRAVGGVTGFVYQQVSKLADVTTEVIHHSSDEQAAVTSMDLRIKWTSAQKFETFWRQNGTAEWTTMPDGGAIVEQPYARVNSTSTCAQGYVKSLAIMAGEGPVRLTKFTVL